MTPQEIKALRKRLKVTTDRLGQLIGVKGDTVRHWECGSRNPSGSAIKILSAIQNDFSELETKE